MEGIGNRDQGTRTGGQEAGDCNRQTGAEDVVARLAALDGRWRLEATAVPQLLDPEAMRLSGFFIKKKPPWIAPEMATSTVEPL
jgi:hypothetical protein